MLSPELLKILVCPRCKGALEHNAAEQEESLLCTACALRFPVVDDIPVMRLDKAQPLDDSQSTTSGP